MNFQWHDQKNAANFAKHGISFDEAIRIFRHPVFTKIDDRRDYGEVREVSTGLLDGLVVLVVVHADRDGTTRLISARPAKRAERKAYYDNYQEDTGGH